MGRFAKPQHPYLRRHDRSWHIQLAVPGDIHDEVGCKVREKSLHTEAMDQAEERARLILVQWQAEFDAARQMLGMEPNVFRRSLWQGGMAAFDGLQNGPRDGVADRQETAIVIPLFPDAGDTTNGDED